MTVAAFVLFCLLTLVLSAIATVVLFSVIGAASWQRAELDDEWVSMCQPRVATPIDAVAMPTAGASIASGAGRTRGASAVANVFATSGFVPSGFAPSGFHAGGR